MEILNLLISSKIKINKKAMTSVAEFVHNFLENMAYESTCLIVRENA